MTNQHDGDIMRIEKVLCIVVLSAEMKLREALKRGLNMENEFAIVVISTGLGFLLGFAMCHVMNENAGSNGD